MFNSDTIAFLRDLEAHNSKDWFTENRPRYQEHWKAAAEAFCDVMAAELAKIQGGPVTPKLFRIHRDVRFAKDKTPYKPHVHMIFYPDGRRDLGWMVGLEPARLMLGFGLFQFTPPQLDAWRRAVDGAAGPEIAAILAEGQASGLRLNEPALKRAPAPFAKEHPRGDLLRRKGVALWKDDLPQAAAFGDAAPPRLAAECAVFGPLHRWLAAHVPG